MAILYAYTVYTVQQTDDAESSHENELYCVRPSQGISQFTVKPLCVIRTPCIVMQTVLTWHGGWAVKRENTVTNLAAHCTADFTVDSTVWHKIPMSMPMSMSMSLSMCKSVHGRVLVHFNFRFKFMFTQS